MKNEKTADDVLKRVWRIMGPLPAPSCSGCRAELEMALKEIADFYGWDPSVYRPTE